MIAPPDPELTPIPSTERAPYSNEWADGTVYREVPVLSQGAINARKRNRTRMVTISLLLFLLFIIVSLGGAAIHEGHVRDTKQQDGGHKQFLGP